jgi:ADP-heptose:LPS heptosyltransferase
VRKILPPKRILLIRLKGIGDVILSTPLLRALKKKFPSTELHFLTRSFCAPILKNNPRVDRLIVHPEKSAPFKEKLKFLTRLRDPHYDWVLDLAAEPRSAWLTLVTGAPLRAGYAFRFREFAFTHKIPKNKIRKYQGEINLDIIRYLGVPDDGNQTEIFLEDGEQRWAADAWATLKEKGKLKLKVGLNPTGAWESKRWPLDHWRRLAALIHDRWGIQPVLCGGPGDKKILEEVRWGIEEKVLLMPETDLLQAAAFISGMDLLIGNDGTPQHIAQTFGVKSLTLCGPHWGIGWTKPNDFRHRYLQHFLDCGPCDLNICPFPRVQGQAPHVHQECLVKITPENVLGVAGEMLGIS